MAFKKTMKRTRSKSQKRKKSKSIKRGGFIRDGSTQQFWGVPGNANNMKKSRNNRNRRRNGNRNERRNRLSVTYNNGEFDFKYI